MRPNKGEEEPGERHKMNNLKHRRTRIENYYKRRVKPQAKFGYESLHRVVESECTGFKNGRQKGGSECTAMH